MDRNETKVAHAYDDGPGWDIRMRQRDARVAIAEEIRRQIGKGALFMLGAKDLTALEAPGGLRFRVRGSRVANVVIVRLNGRDLSDVEIGKMGKAPHFRYSVVTTWTDTYADMLRELIEEGTGLRTRL